MSVQHTIRSKNGGTETVRLTPLTAITANCRECLGWETEPSACTSPNCPLYPFRTGDGHSGKVVKPEVAKAASERMRMNNPKKVKSTSLQLQNRPVNVSERVYTGDWSRELFGQS